MVMSECIFEVKVKSVIQTALTMHDVGSSKHHDLNASVSYLEDLHTWVEVMVSACTLNFIVQLFLIAMVFTPCRTEPRRYTAR